ncbi:zinc finger CCCH domain-containing protein 44-like [Dorcoceras hygrometricum]|uniref:Zinc finger CCCH domain-containing protein 44-like n=1 Tax=Dorcoceras hygrometricum TaxID=472368 RepID=A0A2Z7A654_9LAMI|nr:zinc finger CCCH domain-containing protein 44-like [Dorcoceras hygrometricum]
MENIETLLAAVAQTQGFSDDEDDVSVGRKGGVEGSVSLPEIRRDAGSSQLTDVPPAVGGGSEASAVVNQVPTSEIQVVPTTGVVIGAGDRRKRGRPPKGQLVEKPPPPKRRKQEDEEEDVCFICFDGGSLVLCDRKGCPKAYHPACIKREEAFFRSKAKWNCGWHICSTCQKSSHYMCYTCTYSLCKGCAKDTDYLCVRGNKGFCTICLKMIMLIENKDHANEDAVQVDFDDKTSWEYLFKVYWTCLKDKLSLTWSELAQARSPWTGAHAVASKPQVINIHDPSRDGIALSYMGSVHSELRNPHEEMRLLQNNQLSMATSSIHNQVEKSISYERESVVGTGKHSVSNDRDKPGFDKNTDKSSTVEVSVSEFATDQVVMEKNRNNHGNGKDTDNLDIGKEAGKQRHKGIDKSEIVGKTEWASRYLLEFVGHMKNGDISPLSQFDVQTLLLDYVKRNNLRDPRQKSQIICDHRLKNLFGKPRVGHIEMLKLLEFHFLMKENCPSSFIPAGFVCSTACDVEVDGNNDSSLTTTNSKRQKTRKKSEDGAPQNKLHEYAAVDIHNMNLICLRRNLLEILIEDKDNFHDKVVGTVVRIRISPYDQKQDIYRLVQVVGTSKVAEPYKIGEKTTDVMLEVLNLNKKEVVSLDAISNSAATEDECRRLRQSIRCGLVKQFTVGEVQKKAMELQPVRLNDLLEAEILRLNHLRDRASEKGHKKELREYVRKLQLLKSPEERQRRIAEIPVVHDDPKMSPAYESEEDVRSADNPRKDETKPKSSVFTGTGRNTMSPDKEGKREGSIQAQNKVIERVDASGSISSDVHINQANVSNPTTIGMDVQAMLRSVGLETSTASQSVGNSPTTSNIETEKLWHYRDPNGKIQGPFAMLQLRKWNTTGLFPQDMRIWTNHEQYDSLLLTDALSRQFHGASDLPYNLLTGLPDLGATGGDRGVNGTVGDSNQIEMALYEKSNVLSGNSIRFVRADDSGTSHPQAWDFLKDNNSSADNVQVRSSHPSYASLPDRSKDPHNGENASSGLNQNQLTNALEFQNQSNNRCQADQSSEENIRTLPVDLSSVEFESTSAPVSKSTESFKQDRSKNVPNLPCAAPKTTEKLVVVETAEEQQAVSLDVPMQNPGILELLSPVPRPNNEDQGDQATETKQYDFINFIVPNAGPSWSNSSGPGVANLQLPEVADEWCGYSPTPAKPAGQEWHSGFLSPSSLKPLEVTSDNVTATTSNNGQITHTSPPNIPNWLAMFNEPIEFDALGEESVSDLLAEVDAMESQGGFPSPTSAMKFAKELIQDCKDDCFSSIEFSHLHDSGKNDALSSTGDIQLACQPSVPCKPAVETSFIDGLDSFRRSSVHSSASSEGETDAPLYPFEGGSEFHHPPASVNTSQEMVGATMVLGTGSEPNDPAWGTVQGNINLVTVQGNVNLVLGGPTQGMANLGWGSNPGTAWGNPGVNLTPVNGNLPWDGQRKYSSPREWGYQGGEPGGFGRGRTPWGRQQYGGSSGGGGYSRPPPKGQRVCKFYESGRCKKGAFCDYLHP